MVKKFAGFNPGQKEAIARQMGYSGPVEEFDQFLASSPDHMSQWQNYEEAAKTAVEGKYAKGGLIDKKPPNGFSIEGEKLSYTLPKTAGTKVTKQLLNNPQKFVTDVETKHLTPQKRQFVSTQSGQAGAAETASTSTGTATEAATPDGLQTNTYDATTTQPAVENALTGMEAAQGTVSDETKVEAAQAQPSSQATVQGQLENLMAGFEGGQVPAWAAGAQRKVDAIMAQRGLGASSMAASASMQAAMESALQIAVADASTYAAFEMKNLDNRQQAAVVNAQSFLAMDLANLDNEQQMTLFKSQSTIQSLFNDQAADNAAKQFNATSKNQTDQFFASLKSQVQQFNAAQQNAMTQFNASESNATSKFNAQVQNQREEFNAANRLVVDQSNAQWRRQVATINNENINEANRLEAQAATQMTMAAYNNMMQRERDFYSFAFTSAENKKDRANQLLLAQFQIDAAQDGAMGEVVGGLLGSLADNVMKKIFA